MPPFHGPTSPPPGAGHFQPTNFGWLIFFFWLIFIIYWIVSAQGIKKDIAVPNEWKRTIGARIAMTIVIILLVVLFGSQFSKIVFSPTVQAIGVVLVAVGVAFAIWARAHLGRNWTSHPAMKEGHELVTSGPYRFVRHPIYTGVLLGILGSALVSGAFWFMVFIFGAITFIWRIKVEEGFMMKLFPDTYPAYKKRTKALIPFIY